MRRILILGLLMLLSFGAIAQLEVKEGSFKEVAGFVNINTDKMYDDNDKPYAVLKIKTENINDKQRHELLFQGNAATFFEIEYKVGEVWVYLSYYATYIKISHPDLSSTEFWFPFDMEPKKGYEMVLMNKTVKNNEGWGSLSIITEPENGATIALNGRLMSQKTPYINDMISTGIYEIKIFKPGYDTIVQKIEIKDGAKEVLNIVLNNNKNGIIENRIYTVNGVSFDMVFVKGGIFTMGCTSSDDKDCLEDEKPTQSNSLNDYYIGKYEVTQSLWEAVMNSNPSNWKGENLPVEQVNWEECQSFIRKLNQLTCQNFRLPTEAEWEYAARGGNKSCEYLYSGDNNIKNVAWYTDNSRNTTHPVGKKTPNELGLYDMSGNVFEWCQDTWYNYSSLHNNQTDTDMSNYRVIRGGCFAVYAWLCKVWYRSYYDQDEHSNDIGFRLVLEP